jgi:hypothetical protein
MEEKTVTAEGNPRYILTGFGEEGKPYMFSFDLPFDPSKSDEWKYVAEAKEIGVIETEEDLCSMLEDPECGRSVLLKFDDEYEISMIMEFCGDYPSIY